MADAAFYFDIAGPASYFAAERAIATLGAPAQWIPVLQTQLGDPPPIDRDQLAGGERELGLQPLRLPRAFPFDSRTAMLAATYAKSIGRVVAFSQAAFRQAYAGGHDLSDENYVLIAAAACEMHPRAVLAALRSTLVASALERACGEAREAGVRTLPAMRVDGDIFEGPALLELAAARIASAA